MKFLTDFKIFLLLKNNLNSFSFLWFQCNSLICNFSVIFRVIRIICFKSGNNFIIWKFKFSNVFYAFFATFWIGNFDIRNIKVLALQVYIQFQHAWLYKALGVSHKFWIVFFVSLHNMQFFKVLYFYTWRRWEYGNCRTNIFGLIIKQNHVWWYKTLVRHVIRKAHLLMCSA